MTSPIYMGVSDLKLKGRKIERKVEMAALELERGIERLRPLVNSQPWDYCVIWKLGDDPSRFIEWGACCCSSVTRAAAGIQINGENLWEKKKKMHLVEECRDMNLIKHPVTTNGCNNLAQLPYVIPLYSGIHGDVVISKRPRWTTQSNANEPNGTQVLIPVTGGLIELFTTQHVPRDQRIIDFISARFRGPPNQESMTENAENNYQENCCPPPFHYQISQPTNYSSFEGSSTCSSLSYEHQLLQVGHDHVLSGMSLEKPSKDYVDSPASRNPRLRRKKCADFACTDGNEKEGAKASQKIEKGPFKSKNLTTERNRRKRIKERELALRALVPNITKMDKLSILTDAADYIKKLVETVRSYHDELQALEEEACSEVNEAECSMLVRDCTVKKSDGSEKTQIVVGVEVIQLGTNDFLVKIISRQTRGGFSRLMEAIDCLGLQVEDANVTTLHGLVSNVFRVEAMREDLDPIALKDSLVELVN